MTCYRLNTLEYPILLSLNMLDCMVFDEWVKLHVADRSHPQSKNFVMGVKNVVTQNLMTAPQAYSFKLMVSARAIKWFSPILPTYFFACLRNFSSKIFIKNNPKSHNDTQCSFKLKLIWIKASFENSFHRSIKSHDQTINTHQHTSESNLLKV